MSGDKLAQFVPAARPRHDATRLQCYSSWELRTLPDPDWLVDQLIPAGGMVLPVGRKGAAKTFVTIDLAMHIAAGMDWQGRKVRGGPMLYLYGEGTLKRRVQAWRSAHHVPDGELVGEQFGWDVTYVPGTVNLLNPKAVRTFVEQVQSEELGPVPVGIVLETLTRMAPGDENSPEWGGQVAEACGIIQQATGAAVLLPHHTPWSKDKGDQRPRGHTRLTDAADAVLLLEKPGRGAGPVTLTPLWLRESDDEYKVHLKLTPHDGTLVVDRGAAPAPDVGTEDLAVVLAAEKLPPEFSVEQLAAEMVLSPSRAEKRLRPVVNAGKVRVAQAGRRGHKALYALVGPVPGREAA